jgi:hypothetical protein
MMNSDLQNKMYHFEADPPKEVWNKIADALNADGEQTFTQRLLHYEEHPPARIWDKIEAGLEESEPAVKVIPITRFKKPLRYIAAAASIIAIVFLATNLVNKDAATGSMVGGTETIAPTNQSSVIPLDQPTIAGSKEQTQHEMTDQATGEEINETAKTQRQRPPASVRPQHIFRSFSFSRRFIPQSAKEETLDFSDLDNYMVYSDGDGNAMRVPKKLFHLVYCDDNDDSCKEHIRRLQKKMATAAISTDFGGVLEILRQLQ